MPTVNIDPPTLHRLFNGPLLADELQARYLSGIAAVYRLEPAAFGPDLDPAGRIMTAIDLQLPTIDWENSHRIDGITREQRRITIIRFPIAGHSDRLTWIPTERQIGAPSQHFGISDNTLTIVCTGHTLTDDTVNAAIAQTRRHITANIVHQVTELATWRADTARRIHDAVTARATLLDALPAKPGQN